MRVLLSTYGSRGDVEPMAALAVELQKLGVEAVVSAPSDREFADLLARAGRSGKTVADRPAHIRSPDGRCTI
jgi:UDP:flavonoid glycosyltransferase YjiC (YdhE family)